MVKSKSHLKFFRLTCFWPFNPKATLRCRMLYKINSSQTSWMSDMYKIWQRWLQGNGNSNKSHYNVCSGSGSGSRFGSGSGSGCLLLFIFLLLVRRPHVVRPCRLLARLCAGSCARSLHAATPDTEPGPRERTPRDSEQCSSRPSCIRCSITFSLTLDTTFQIATFNHNDCYYIAGRSNCFLSHSTAGQYRHKCSARCWKCCGI